MLLNRTRGPTRLNVCDLHDLLFRNRSREQRHTNTYVLSLSASSALSYRKLRSILSHTSPIHILLEQESRVATAAPSRRTNRTNQKSNRNETSVYRTLIRSQSQPSISFDRVSLNNTMRLVGNALTMTSSQLPVTSMVRALLSRYLSAIVQRHAASRDQQHERIRTSETPSRLSRTASVRLTELTSGQVPSSTMFHRTLLVNQSDDFSRCAQAMTAMISSCESNERTRKQLHIYMP
jgi:hypothetical protein